jgi:hypothetical protein
MDLNIGQIQAINPMDNNTQTNHTGEMGAAAGIC